MKNDLPVKRIKHSFNIDNVVENEWRDPMHIIEKLCRFNNLSIKYYTDILLDNYILARRENYKIVGEDCLRHQFHQKYMKEALASTLRSITNEVYENNVSLKSILEAGEEDE